MGERVPMKVIRNQITKTLVPGGHAFKVEKGTVDDIEDFSLGDYHDGPQCAKCGAIECRWCNPDFMTEQCRNKDETLPGLEFE